MKWFLVLFFTTLSVCSIQPLTLQAFDEVVTAEAQLTRQLKIIDEISPHVERIDLARLRMITLMIKEVQTSIKQRGLSNIGTLTLYQQLIVTFRFSRSFFKQIDSEFSHEKIIELLKINEDIVVARGFDDSPYTQITANVYKQMHKLVLQLANGPWLEAPIKQKLQALVAPIARVIAIAKEGDRPRTFEAAVPVYRSIEALYPDFNAIMRSHAAFDLVLEIQGLNEFYAEFAQIDPEKDESN